MGDGSSSSLRAIPLVELCSVPISLSRVAPIFGTLEPLRPSSWLLSREKDARLSPASPSLCFSVGLGLS